MRRLVRDETELSDKRYTVESDSHTGFRYACVFGKGACSLISIVPEVAWIIGSTMRTKSIFSSSAHFHHFSILVVLCQLLLRHLV